VANGSTSEHARVELAEAGLREHAPRKPGCAEPRFSPPLHMGLTADRHHNTLGMLLVCHVVFGSVLLTTKEQAEPESRDRARGNPVRIRNCPAAVSRNERSHKH